MMNALHRPLALLCATALASTPTQAQITDPFSPGERWADASSTAVPWLPDSIAFAGAEQLVAAVSRGAGGGLAVRAVDGDGVARAFDARFAAAHGAPLLAAGDRADALYTLAQYPDPDSYSRRVELTRHDPMAAARGANFEPVWIRELDIRINGPARVVTDSEGDLVVAAAWNDRTANVRIDRVDGETGILLARRDLPAIGLSQIAMSDDGSTLAVAAGLDLWFLDENLDVVTRRTLPSAAQALALSADGRTLAFGAVGRLEVLRINGQGLWAAYRTLSGATSELAAAVSLSESGESVAVAWWNYMNGTSARLDLWDVDAGTIDATWAQHGTSNSHQNLPGAVEITADGGRAAFGLWGTGGSPQVVLLEAGLASPRASFYLPGSVRALDLDASGTRVAVAHKNVHNSQWGAAGSVRLLDTGERQLALTAVAEVGGDLRAATLRPGAGIAFFAVGEAAEAQFFPGVTNPLLLRRGTLTVWPSAVDANGRADFVLPLSADPQWIGRRLHLQSAFRTPAGLELSSNRVDALVLD